MAYWHVFIVLFLSSTGTNHAAVFTFENRCRETIWPGTQSGARNPPLMNGGFELKPQETTRIVAPTGWSGRFWGRTGCIFDQSGKGSCTTGDCGGVLQCNGAGGVPPASLAEFTLNSPLDFYDVSLVDGFNLPVSVIPLGGSGNCSEVRCDSDLNIGCPRDLQVSGGNGGIVACKSACNAFNQPQYCCTGEYNNPQVCKPTSYSEVFKKACPTAYSYPYDDRSSTFTCQGADYLIIFC